LAEIDCDLLAPLAVNTDSSVFKVNIRYIKSHALGDPDAGAQQESEDGQIPNFGLRMKFLLLFCQFISLFHLVQKKRHLVHIQTDDFLIMKLGKADQSGGIIFYPLISVKIIVK